MLISDGCTMKRYWWVSEPCWGERFQCHRSGSLLSRLDHHGNIGCTYNLVHRRLCSEFYKIKILSWGNMLYTNLLSCTLKYKKCHRTKLLITAAPVISITVCFFHGIQGIQLVMQKKFFFLFASSNVNTLHFKQSIIYTHIYKNDPGTAAVDHFGWCSKWFPYGTVSNINAV